MITNKEAALSQEVRLNTDIISYTLAYKDVSDELAGDLSTKQKDMVGCDGRRWWTNDNARMVMTMMIMMVVVAVLMTMPMVMIMTWWNLGDQETSEPRELERNPHVGGEAGIWNTQTEERKIQTILLSLAYKKILTLLTSMNFQLHFMNI